jgi:hypothetical protein
MRKPGATIAAIAAAGTIAVIAVSPSQAASRKHMYPYDGLWSVSIRTQFGPCDPAYRYPARIVQGQVTQAENDFSYQITGAVVSSGAIAVTVSKGLGSATGRGRLYGGSGGGRWSAGNNQCYGTWTAMRRASN